MNLNIFDNEINKKKESATYLLYADNRIDLKEYAKIFAKRVYEINYNETYENIFEHFDVFYNGDSKLNIQDIKNIIKEANISTYTNKKKIIIINNIDKIDINTSNVLLKTIEEPVKNLYFILLTRSLNILPTIKSRCILFEIKPENTDVDKKIYKILDGNEVLINQYKLNKEIYDERINNIDIDIDEIIFKAFSHDDKTLSKIYQDYLVTKIIDIKYNMKEVNILISKIINRLKNSDKIDEHINDFMAKLLLKDIEIDKNKYIKLSNIKMSMNRNINSVKLFKLFYVIYLE